MIPSPIETWNVIAEAPAVERHEFAHVLRTVGRGPTLSRPLTLDEAEAAMAMVLDGRAEPLQVGAFLLLLRYRGETVEELTGFTRAARARLANGATARVDLDWPSYADAHKQLPYFLLAALLLAGNGMRVLMHGLAGVGGGTTRHGLAALGLRPARSAAEAAATIEATGFAYLPVETMLPALAEILDLKPVLGLRSFANTMARELNPFHAPCQIQGVFHPPYLELHRGTQRLLGQPRAASFKGGGGEAQRNPDKPCRSAALAGGADGDLIWPQLTESGWPWRGETLDVSRLGGLWRGEWHEPSPVAAVTGTAAMALWLAGKAADPETADQLAARLWDDRDRALPNAA